MKSKHIVILALATLACFFYPGDHFLYRLERMHPEAFTTPKPLPTLAYPIPVLKEGVAAPKLSARGVYVVERKTFTPVFAKNADTLLYPASTAKMVTALAAIDSYPLERVVRVTVATDEGQLMGLVEGERMTIENLLYGTLVHSGNDAAYALAYANGQYRAFIDHMNLVAHRIGMRKTTFKNPSGLDEEGQLTTPHDLALAAQALLESPPLRKMVSTKEITVLDEDYRMTHVLTNVNQLLGTIEGLGGVKTGYTEAAGENLVSYFKTPYTGHEYIIVVMKSTDRFRDTQLLTEWLTYSIEYLDL